MNAKRFFIIAVWLFLAAVLPGQIFGQTAGQAKKTQTVTERPNASDQTPHWEGKASDWNGYVRHDFDFAGRAAYVVSPKQAAPGNPWIFRARFPNFHTEIDLILLKRGFHIARLNTDGMLGSPAAIDDWLKFHTFLTKLGLAQKCVLEGVSRGGLFVYGFASRFPDKVACIYCDTPVCDIRSWPGGKGQGKGDQSTWKVCLKAYGLTEESAKDFKQNPIDRLANIAKAKIPIMHIVSMNDQIVPPTENTFVLAERYRKLGGSIDVIEISAGTPSSSGHHFTHVDPIRIADFIERHGSVFPLGKDYHAVRGALDNCRLKFETMKQGRVVFLGGSITTMKGWRDLTADYLQSKFPETKFEFIDAGISSTGSTPGAFRLLRDAFANGEIDLLFEEAAVNDLHNMREPQEMIRGMEGILRHARTVNPNLDIVMMHFVDPAHMISYRAGQTPIVIEQHESVAQHYDVTSINLAAEVTERIDASQFNWKDDFKNCHPSPYGHEIYVSSIRRALNAAWDKPLTANSLPKPHAMPMPMDRFSYDRATVIPLAKATNLKGFAVVEKCDPRANGVGGSVRGRFHNVEMLVANEPGDQFTFEFSGRAVGLLVAAGPDAGVIEYSIDGGEFKSLDLFTKWSKGLHIPWANILESELAPGKHELQVRVTAIQNGKSSGHACRIVNLLVNE